MRLLLAPVLLLGLLSPGVARLGGDCRPADTAPGAIDGIFLMRTQADMDALAAGCTVRPRVLCARKL